MIRVFLGNSNSIILEGLRSILNQIPGIAVVGSSLSSQELFSQVTSDTDVLLIDYSSEYFDLMDIKKTQTLFPNIGIVGITDYANKEMYKSALGLGLKGHILNCCDAKELQESIEAAAQNEQYYCEKVLDTLNEVPISNTISCGGIKLTKREIEVIGLIAEGLTNNEISDQLCLSNHTIMTHRKNIMSKLGITNTAGMVMFAVKQKIVQPNKFLFAN